MKKLLSTLLMFALALSLFSAVNSSPAATVNLIRNKVITVDELEKRAKELGATADQTLEVLNVMINDEVFMQGAERDGIKVSAAELDGIYSQYRSTIESQIGRSLTPEEYEEFAKQQSGSVENFKEQLKEQYIVQAYLMQVKGDELNGGNYMPTDAQIKNFYRAHQTDFVQPENVRFAHIVKAKSESTDAAVAEKENKASKETMESVKKRIDSGEITFEQAVQDYTDDEESKATAGEKGWLTSDNTGVREGWGDEFVDTVLGLQVGKVSDVIESKIGYHIVRIGLHNDAKLLTINDRLDPSQSTTVYDYIQAGLAQQNANQAMSDALNEMISDLRSQARIRIIYK